MIVLTRNGSNTVYMTLEEAKKYANPIGTDYVLELRSMQTQEVHTCKPHVGTENERYTQLVFATNVDSPINGGMLLQEGAHYYYRIIAARRPSAKQLTIEHWETETNPVLERGVCRVEDEQLENAVVPEVPVSYVYYQ